MAGTKTPIPGRIKPQLESLVTKPPTDGAWRWEIKIDGFRFLARTDGRVVQLFTKNGHDWMNKVLRLARNHQTGKLDRHISVAVAAYRFEQHCQNAKAYAT